MMIRTALTLAMGALLSLGAVAQEAPAETEVSNFTLENGLEVVVIPDHRAPIVTHMVWYKVGSADEPPGKSGIAHFLEHLMFKGTEKHPAGEMDSVIAEIGGYTNAFTSRDVTVYHQTVPPDYLDEMMDFEADRMRGLVLPEQVIDAERNVVLEERNQRIEGSPQALLSEETTATLFQNHPYRIPVIGWMHEMEELNREDALDFYGRFYAPNNAVLVVAGDVEPDQVRTLAEATYGQVERGPDLPLRVRPSEPTYDTARTVTLSDPRIGVPSFTMGWVAPSYRVAEEGEAEALDLLAEILGGGSRSRFYQEIVVKSGLASAVGAGYDGGAYDPSSFTLYGMPQGEHTLEEVETAVKTEVRRLIEDGVTAEELDAAKMRFVRSLIFARDEQDSMANIYGSRLANEGTVEDIAEWPDRIQAVTPEQIQAVAGKYLDPAISVTSYLLPTEAGSEAQAPAEPEAEAAAEAQRGAEIQTEEQP